ncbi:MAG TPA: ATP-binding protein [Chloroflexota bacterium]|nr:ATP-binding protein [Chloroflexota bacterium]
MDEKPLTVLLIEDNPGDARLIRELLNEVRAVGFRLKWVTALSDGLLSLEHDAADVVLLDLMLPDSRGMETFYAVRGAFPRVPVVVLSGLVDEEVALKAVREGAQDYLVKGNVDGHLLIRAIGYAIERHQLKEGQRFLLEASATLAESLEYETTLQRIAHLAVPFLADECAVDLLSSDHEVHLAAVAHRDSRLEQVLRDLRLANPLDLNSSHPVAKVLRSGRPEIVTEFTDEQLAAFAPDVDQVDILKEFALTSAMLIPLVARGRTLGCFTLLQVGSGRRFDSSDLTIGTDLGRRAALAIDNALLYRQLHEAVSLRDSVLSSVSHDLRNPLTAIQVIADTGALYARNIRSNRIPPVLEAFDRVEVNVRRMTAQIDELIDVGQLQTGQGIRLVKEPVDLVPLIKDMAREYQERTRRHCIKVDTSVESLVGAWDAGRLERVFGNLLSNAVKYSFHGGDISVRLADEERAGQKWAVVAVQDHGLGIPAADLPRMFTWFHRGANVADSVAGAGIGLAGSRQIVERHGGTIEVESQEGRGSTFTVRLPTRPSPQ